MERIVILTAMTTKPYSTWINSNFKQTDARITEYISHNDFKKEMMGEPPMYRYTPPPPLTELLNYTVNYLEDKHAGLTRLGCFVMNCIAKVDVIYFGKNPIPYLKEVLYPSIEDKAKRLNVATALFIDRRMGQDVHDAVLFISATNKRYVRALVHRDHYALNISNNSYMPSLTPENIYICTDSSSTLCPTCLGEVSTTLNDLDIFVAHQKGVCRYCGVSYTLSAAPKCGDEFIFLGM